MRPRVERGFGQWLRSAMDRAGLRRNEDLAALIGANESTVSRWRRGAWPRAAQIGPLAKALGVPREVVEWYAGFDVSDPTRATSEMHPVRLPVVPAEPLLDQVQRQMFPLPEVPIGESVIAAGMDSWSGAISSGVLRLFEGRANIGVAEVSGSCMEPEIDPGDAVLIDRADLFPRAGTLVAFLVEGDGVMVKRLANEGGQLVAVDNQGVRYTPTHAVLLGRVVAVTKRV